MSVHSCELLMESNTVNADVKFKQRETLSQLLQILVCVWRHCPYNLALQRILKENKQFKAVTKKKQYYFMLHFCRASAEVPLQSTCAIKKCVCVCVYV